MATILESFSNFRFWTKNGPKMAKSNQAKTVQHRPYQGHSWRPPGRGGGGSGPIPLPLIYLTESQNCEDFSTSAAHKRCHSRIFLQFIFHVLHNFPHSCKFWWLLQFLPSFVLSCFQCSRDPWVFSQLWWNIKKKTVVSFFDHVFFVQHDFKCSLKFKQHLSFKFVSFHHQKMCSPQNIFMIFF